MINRCIHQAAMLFISGTVYSCQLEPFVSLLGEESPSTDSEESSDHDAHLPSASSSTTSLPEDTSDPSTSDTTENSSESSASSTSSPEDSQNDDSDQDSESDSGSVDADSESVDSESGTPDPPSSSEADSDSTETSSSNEDDQGESESEGSESEEDEGNSTSDSNDENCNAAVVYTFDSGPEGWRTGQANLQSSGNSWEWGFTNRLHAFVWATSLDDFCLNNESSYVASPTFSLAGCQNSKVTLVIHHWYAFSDIIGYVPGDGGIVEVSLDGGTTWDWIEAKGHKYCPTPIYSSFLPVKNKLGFCRYSQNLTFYESRFDLSPYAMKEESLVAIRFVIGTNHDIREPGWYINQVEIEVD